MKTCSLTAILLTWLPTAAHGFSNSTSFSKLSVVSNVSWIFVGCSAFGVCNRYIIIIIIIWIGPLKWYLCSDLPLFHHPKNQNMSKTSGISFEHSRGKRLWSHSQTKLFLYPGYPYHKHANKKKKLKPNAGVTLSVTSLETVTTKFYTVSQSQSCFIWLVVVVKSLFC